MSFAHQLASNVLKRMCDRQRDFSRESRNSSSFLRDKSLGPMVYWHCTSRLLLFRFTEIFVVRKLNEQATCRGMAISQSAKFQSPILPDWWIASVLCSYSVAVSLRKYLASINAIEISMRAEPKVTK